MKTNKVRVCEFKWNIVRRATWKKAKEEISLKEVENLISTENYYRPYCKQHSKAYNSPPSKYFWDSLLCRYTHKMLTWSDRGRNTVIIFVHSSVKYSHEAGNFTRTFSSIVINEKLYTATTEAAMYTTPTQLSLHKRCCDNELVF